MTEKLYWKQSHLREFDAVVTNLVQKEAAVYAVLDRSAFYPEGGGQPCDQGWIGSLRVSEVSISEDGTIFHKLEAAPAFQIGERIEARIDWEWRREMMQQHTGQHILSQAFFRLYGAETKGFRITDYSTEIDLTLEAHPEEMEAAIQQAEEQANGIVFENREIRSHEVTTEEAAKLPLRKESFITDCVRVIEIDDYDWSPCGGTHARRTGEVGLIAVRAWERAKKMTRVHFLCGVRLLRDYRRSNRAMNSLGRRLSVGREELETSVVRLQDEGKRLSRRVHQLAEIAADIEAREILSSVGLSNGIRVVTRVFDDRDFEETKLLAHRLVAGEGVIALLAAHEAEMARLVFARSGNLSADMNAALKQACEKLGGRGGGKPDFAQGGGTRIAELQAVMEGVRAALG
jgi:alanyl-tRNA synthetase